MSRILRTTTATLGVLLLTCAVASCASSDDASKSAGSSGAKATTTRPNDPADAAAAYVGLTKAAAIARAEREQRPWRIGREDDEQFMLTQDFVENRVTFELDDGKVTKATLG
ncbi:MAG TPA: hypothetical protein VFZ17_10310 [Acidimicrobiia bacterium]|nr:hypothetical protein [Acidimicrobiia bacterium]